MAEFQFLLSLAAPLDKGGSATSAYCYKDLCYTRARQAELGVTPATSAFVLEARRQDGWR